MAEKILMPQGGQDLQFGTIVRWLKKEGDPVEKGELICEVETEKAVFEVTAPSAGVLLKILKHDGEEAEVLSAIGYIGQPGESIDILGADVKSEPETVHIEKTQTIQTGKLPREKIRISPKARKLARDHGIDFTKIKSDRPDSKITTKMVFDAMQSLSIEPVDTSLNGREVKIKRAQRVAADRLARSWQQAPHFFVTVSVDMTDLITLRESYNNDSDNQKVSINDVIIKAAACALKEYPDVNASYHDQDTIILWDDVHIGFATATDEGLYVPVVEHADRLSLLKISERIKILSESARSGKFVADVPSRFTISNLGMYAVDRFTAIINPPESAILAVGSIKKKPVVDGDEKIVVRDIVEMTLSLDHRVGDGVLAASFINHIKTLLEDPANLFT